MRVIAGRVADVVLHVPDDGVGPVGDIQSSVVTNLEVTNNLDITPEVRARVMLTSLDFFILQGQVDIGGEPARRSVSITEINGIDANTRNLRMNELFRWDAALDKHVAANTSYAIDQARAKMGWTRTRLEEELAERRDILQGLVERKERHYRDVAKAVRTFYTERGAAEAGVADAKRPRSKGSA